MNIRYGVAAILVCLVAGIAALVVWLPRPEYPIDFIAINDATQSIAHDFDTLGTEDYVLPHYENLDYAVINTEGVLLAASKQGISECLSDALQHGDVIVDIVREGKVCGKLLVYNDAERMWQAYRAQVLVITTVMLVLMAAVCVLSLAAVRRKVLLPFKKMRSFAQRVARGNFDTPLEMDKGNAFGAFTESFDLMRDELHRAKENERRAEQSKRELLASLSHDIQTPVASIRAVAEVMELSAHEAQRQKLAIIQQKAGHIHALVGDLFHATLKDLNTLSVNPIACASHELIGMIMQADYQGRAAIQTIPECLLTIDPTRLTQVMDNIFANSYKYADTALEVSGEFDHDNILLIFRDFGPGALDDEMPHLCTQYYRGKEAEGKRGYGLGLFIAHYLVERMGGRLHCENATPGFIVKIWLKLDKENCKEP